MLTMQCNLMPLILTVRRSYVAASASCSVHQSLKSIICIADGEPGYGYDWWHPNFCPTYTMFAAIWNHPATREVVSVDGSNCTMKKSWCAWYFLVTEPVVYPRSMLPQITRSSVVLTATLDLINDMCDSTCQKKCIDITHPCFSL